MKKMTLITLLLASSWFIAGAQVSVSINIGTQPVWGPVGYDHADYYYLPDADAYYDINGGSFMYMEGGSWRSGRSLPGRYSNIDLYHVHKVVINNDRNPWTHHDRYHNQYHSYAGRRDQQAIRDASDRKYWQNPGHPQHAQWQGNTSNGGRPGNGNVRRNDNNPRGNNGNNGRGQGNSNHRNDNNGRGNNNDNHGHNNDNGRTHK